MFSRLSVVVVLLILMLTGCYRSEHVAVNSSEAMDNSVTQKCKFQTESPDHQWRVWVETTTDRMMSQDQPTVYDEICAENNGADKKLEWPDDEHGNLGKLSRPVFSSDSRYVAVFDYDQHCSDRIYIWSLETLAVKVIEPKRRNIKVIGFDKHDSIVVSPEKGNYTKEKM